MLTEDLIGILGTGFFINRSHNLCGSSNLKTWGIQISLKRLGYGKQQLYSE